MFARVLVATDFAPSAEAAWTRALELARVHGSELLLLHVYVELPAYPDIAAAVEVQRIYEEQRQWVQRALDERVALAAGAGVRARAVLRVGPPADTICQTAADERCDLIVVGTHGHHGLERLVLGSVAERVVRDAPCPVLVVKTPPVEQRAAA